MDILNTFCEQTWKQLAYFHVFFVQVASVHSVRFLGDRLYNGSPYAIGPLSVLSVLSVTLVYCGQTVGWIEMKLGMQVGLSPGHILLDGDPPPYPQRGTAPPNFRPTSVVAKWLDGSRCHLVWR